MRLNRFTIIEIVTASTLMLIMFMIIGFVFGSVSNASATINDKVSEGIRANQFFSQLADDLNAAYPVFYLGKNPAQAANGSYIDISRPCTANIVGPDLQEEYINGGGINGTTNSYQASHTEFIRCITTNQLNGGLLNYRGFESFSGNDNVDQNDKPVRYVTYAFTGANEVTGFHSNTVYRRDFPLRPDLRKNDTTIRAGYSAGKHVKVGLPGDGETVTTNPPDGDINEKIMLDGIWEVRTKFLETRQNDDIAGFGKKVAVRVTIEYAVFDKTKPYGDPDRYTRHPNADIDGNGKNDRLEHTFTTVIVVYRNNWDK